MKFKVIILTVIFGALSLFIFKSYGQDQPRMNKQERNRMDSLQSIDNKIQDQKKADDQTTIDNAKEAKKVAKEKAKDAKRVERDANAASVESNKALKSEKKAQRARKNADQQSEKASEARDKSDKN